MNIPVPINELSHEDIRAWLKRAPHGQEPLPRLSPDESPYLGILRIERQAKPASRDSLRDGCLQLIREFCARGGGETPYVEELVALASAFKIPEAVEMLATLALEFQELPGIAAEVRLTVLAALVDTPPPRDMAFWGTILAQDPEQYAGLTLSGVLATNPEQAVAMLPRLPDNERLGQAAALKFEIAWDNLPLKYRFQFVQDIQLILPQCGPRFAAPVQAWTESKAQIGIVATNPTLQASVNQRIRTVYENYKAYLQQRTILLLDSRDKFAVYGANHLLGIFDERGKAMRFGYEKFGVTEPFLVQQIGSEDRDKEFFHFDASRISPDSVL